MPKSPSEKTYILKEVPKETIERIEECLTYLSFWELEIKTELSKV